MPHAHDTQPATGPSDSDLETRLRPGGPWGLGLLGPHESLSEVLARDARVMERLGLSYDELADALDLVLKQAFTMYLQPVTVDLNELAPPEPDIPNLHRPETIPRFDLANLPDVNMGFVIGDLQVFLVVFKGWRDCPWGFDAHTRADFMIVNRKTGQSVTGCDLIPHLIRAHHFFAGQVSPYRTDPEQLATILELVATGPTGRAGVPQ